MGLMLFPLSASAVSLGLWQRKQLGPLQSVAKFVVPLVIVVSFASGIYFFMNYVALTYSRAGLYTPLDLIFGVVVLIIGMYLAHKSGSTFICIFAAIMVAYMYAGPYMPGILRHGGIRVSSIITDLSVSLEKGIFGSFWILLMLYVSMFLVFAGLINGYGGMQVILTFARSLIKRSQRLVPQVTVLTTAFMGMISGTPPAIVAALGPVLLPIMDRIGMRRTESGACLAIGAAGGQIMPPIMGVAAFLMVAFIGKSYLYIISRAFPVAIVFFLTLAFSVDLLRKRSIRRSSAKEKITIESSASVQQPGEIELSRERLIGGSATIIISLGVLVGLLIMGFDIPYAGRLLVLAYLGISFIRLLVVNRKQGLIAGLKEFGVGTVQGLVDGGKSIASLFMMIVPITLIISGMVNTALNIKLANWILYLGAENIIYVVVATAILAILFGFAVSTTGTYIVVSVILCPALVQLGMDIFVAHMFVFYYAILSNLTPPVAVSSTVAASIAKTNFVRLAGHAMIMGLPLFIFPMIFVFYPNVLLYNAMTPVILLLMTVAFFGFAYTFYGEKRMLRLLCGPLGVVILFHGLIGLWAGIAAAVAIVVITQAGSIRRLIHIGSLRE